MRRHISTSIDGLLTLHDFELQQMLKSVTDEEGNHPTLDEFKQWLMLEKAKGHRLVRSPNCDNFDPIEGCLGHST